MKSRLQAELASIGRFGVVGFGACVTYILVALLGARLGLGAQSANLVGVFTSTVFSFLGHAYYSFQKNFITRIYILRFIVLSFAVYVLSFGATYIGIALLQWPRPMVVVIIAAIIPLFTWSAGRFWVFR